MGYATGATVPTSTTLAAFLDAVYATKSGTLTGTTATITALEANRFAVSWPAVGVGQNMIYFTFNARPNTSMGYAITH